MATATKRRKIAEELDVLTCTLCNKELKKPKLLSCQHSFCTRCLVQHYYENEEGKPFCCPTCQMDIELGENTVDGVPNNYLYEIIQDTFSNTCTSETKCISCAQDDKQTTATHKCLDCGDTLCQHCYTWHCKFSATKHHVVVPIADLQEGKYQDELSKRKVIYCTFHSTDEQKVPLSSYCDACKCLVCVKCMQSDHREHCFTTIQAVREKQQPLYDQKLSDLQRSEKDREKRLMNIEGAVTDSKQKWGQQETIIYDTATELHAMVDKIKDQKLTEVKIHYQKELENLDKLLKEERNKKSCLAATVAFAQTFREKCSDSDYLCHENDILSRMEKSQREPKDGFRRDVISFKKQEIYPIKERVEAAFGATQKLSVFTPHKLRIAKKKEKFKRSVDIRSMYGLSYNASHGEILVTAGKSIIVLNKDGSTKKMIACEDTNKSLDLHFKDSEIFYTTFARNKRKVLCIDQSGKIRKSVMLPDDDQETNFILSLAVDDDNAVFISSNRKNRIYKWNPDEDKMSIFLSQEMGHDISSPSYLCLTSTGDLVVSNYGDSNILVFSKEGELKWQYDGKEEANCLTKPNGICCDENGYIYVIDTEDCRIHVIHNQKLVGTIPIEQEVKDEPFAPLTLTPDGDLVYGYKNKLVQISIWGKDDD